MDSEHTVCYFYVHVLQMSVTGTYKNDAMLRQITEAVQINNMEVGERMNDRAE